MLDNNGEPVNMEFQSTDIELNEETESELRGDITFTLPDGITLEDFQTANGWEKVDEVDGRQQITLSLESLVAGEEISFRVKVSYWYIFTQIWIYPTIILSLIVWRVRARRKKKKRKRELEEAAETKVIAAGSGKGGLSDNDFAALSAGYDPTAGYDRLRQAAVISTCITMTRITQCMTTSHGISAASRIFSAPVMDRFRGLFSGQQPMRA